MGNHKHFKIHSAQKIKLRRASHNEVISPFKAKKITARRVTFFVNLVEDMSSSNNVPDLSDKPVRSVLKKSVDSVDQRPKQSLPVQTQKRSNIAEMMKRMHHVVVRLTRLDLTKLKYSKTDPKEVILPKEKKVPTLDFCQNCADSFDDIFDEKQREIIKPIEEKWLKPAIKFNEQLTKEVDDMEQEWHDESKKYYRLLNQFDVLLNVYDKEFKKNQMLKKMVSDHSKNTVNLDHNYA